MVYLNLDFMTLVATLVAIGLAAFVFLVHDDTVSRRMNERWTLRGVVVMPVDVWTAPCVLRLTLSRPSCPLPSLGAECHCSGAVGE